MPIPIAIVLIASIPFCILFGWVSSKVEQNDKVN